MPVEYQKTSTIRRGVDRILFNRDATEQPEVTAHMLVVVTGDVDYSSALSAFSKKFLDDVIVFLRPIDATLQSGKVDQIANDIQRLEIVLSKKSEQRFGLADFVAKMNIRNPRCSPLGQFFGH